MNRLNYKTMFLLAMMLIGLPLNAMCQTAETDNDINDVRLQVRVYNKLEKKYVPQVLYVRACQNKQKALDIVKEINEFKRSANVYDGKADRIIREYFHRKSTNHEGEYSCKAIPGMAYLFLHPDVLHTKIIEIKKGTTNYEDSIIVLQLPELPKTSNRKVYYDSMQLIDYHTIINTQCSFPKGKVKSQHRITVQCCLIDCQTEDTVEILPPAYFEGEKYLQYRKKNGITYDANAQVGNINFVKGEPVSVETRFHYPNSHQKKLRSDILYTVESKNKTVMTKEIKGTCLRISPYKLLDYPFSEMELTYEFYEEPNLQVRRNANGELEEYYPSKEEYMENYMTNKQKYLDGTRGFAPGELFFLYGEFEKQGNTEELDQLTDAAYKQLIKQEDYFKTNVMAPYILNKKSVSNINHGIFDPTVLAPLIDVRGRIQEQRYLDDCVGYYFVNRTEIVANQLTTYIKLGDFEKANILFQMLTHNDVFNSATDFFYVLYHLGIYNAIDMNSEKANPIANAVVVNNDKINNPLKTVLEEGDNEAILYTELPELDKSNKAPKLVEMMDDANPKKWYLKAILAARQENSTTAEDAPKYIEYLRRCFSLDSNYKKYYVFDGQFPDELRSKYPDPTIN